MSLREVCHCGCDKTTHFKDLITGERGRCTGVHCNDCFAYVNEHEELAPRTPLADAITQVLGKLRARPNAHRRPHVDTDCRCVACREWARATHSAWCCCALCLP